LPSVQGQAQGPAPTLMFARSQAPAWERTIASSACYYRNQSFQDLVPKLEFGNEQLGNEKFLFINQYQKGFIMKQLLKYICVFIFSALFFINISYAEKMYKYKGKDGTWHFSNLFTKVFHFPGVQGLLARLLVCSFPNSSLGTRSWKLRFLQ